MTSAPIPSHRPSAPGVDQPQIAADRDLRVTLKSLGDLENLRPKTINQRQIIGAEE